MSMKFATAPLLALTLLACENLEVAESSVASPLGFCNGAYAPPVDPPAGCCTLQLPGNLDSFPDPVVPSPVPGYVQISRIYHHPTGSQAIGTYYTTTPTGVCGFAVCVSPPSFAQCPCGQTGN